MAKRAQELECWQLASRLRTAIVAICEQEDVSRRFRFCDGFTEAAGSVCHNISEGFVRFESQQIVQFFTYALSSLEEISDYLVECRARNFIDAARFDAVNDLAEHTRATAINFMKPHRAKLRRDRARKKRQAPRT